MKPERESGHARLHSHARRPIATRSMFSLGLLKLRLFSLFRRRVLGPHAQGIMYRTANGLLAAPLEDSAIGGALGFEGRYDVAEIDRLKALIRPDDVLYVVGTHIGSLLIPLAKTCRVIVGYEANPDTFDYLRINVLLNDVRNARLFNIAAGDTDRTIGFYQNRSNSGGSKIKPKVEQYAYVYDSPRSIEVTMVSIDEHIRREGLEDADGVIMDIEGAEFLALQGAQKALAAARFLYVEFVPHHLANVAGVSNADFFARITPHFDEVVFVKTREGPFEIGGDAKGFLETADRYRRDGRADDLLFLKRS
jgi:FkbM family methyltransferase